ncbi:MAG TPA: tRNA lysidine(34) synthetase TilS [Candidatus Wunengus sp. YC60]|uniref:tRNA lysidine(34) synthetase TilS n=1 Tax=Candidatus Wunengus sp. YC60 TaxID=3367697 RepID=UPI004025EACB
MRLDKVSFGVFKIINKYNLIKPNNSIVVGVSGGPDSVALLNILHSVNSAKNLKLRLHVAHLNHQLRGKSSEEDAQFAENLSKELSLPFILKNVNIQEIANQTKRSIEETARIERYNFFAESSQKYNASAVAIGHTADDNAETILHRILRGTGISGLGGIPIKRPLTTDSTIQIVRPLLFTRRKEIIDYLGKEQRNYRTDISNYETTYLRNKIRLELIPLLEKQYNPNIKNALLQLSQIFTANNEYLSLEAKKILKDATIEHTEDSYAVNTHFLIKQPQILQQLVFQEILEIMQIPLKEITYEHYTKILNEITRTGKGRHFQLPGNLYLWHEHGMLYFKKDTLSKPRIPLLSEIPIQIPGTTLIHPLGQLVSEILDTKDISLDVYKNTKTPGEEIFDLQCIAMPVTVRGRREGDIISPLGVRGHKKIKDLFIDKKIPLKERDAIPIVVMNNQPIWVIGICMDNSVKVTPDTRKILKLSFQRTH